MDCGNDERGNVKLYSYFRSSAAYRTRIALNLKGIAFETASIHLTRNGGEQHAPEFQAVNPQKRVPALALDNGEVLLQSLAIMEYLDEVYPAPPLLPKDPIERAHVRAVAQIIACDIHPLNNVSPLSYLRHTLKADQSAIQEWYRKSPMRDDSTCRLTAFPASSPSTQQPPGFPPSTPRAPTSSRTPHRCER